MSKAHWVALSTGARVGGKTITRLLSHFGSLEAIFEATPDQLTQVQRVGSQTATAISQINLSEIDGKLKALAARGITVLTWEDAAYPANLLHCDDAPPVLFTRGEVVADDARAVALVGTRQPSSRGLALARRLAYELGTRGWTIVSGLALGIDTASHMGALEAGARTLAVLGSGLDRLYPPANTKLAERIICSGALLAEVHPQVSVSPQNLMARNRITSGLSRAVIVVEAQTDGGSVSTAHRAWQQKRAVFAVAGSDAGCDGLIREGADAIPPEGIDWDDLSNRIAFSGKVFT
ncbi:MAG: DNA-processing protein DprA [Anaerolineae bacterium]|nr:DNA-processing protein DprA [Anaerolineae bacterium]